MGMILATIALIFSVTGASQNAPDAKEPAYASFEYDIARTHETKPHRRTIPHEGVAEGDNQLQLELIVSPAGEVLHADAKGEDRILKFWPDLHAEVSQWKFTPFEKDGKPVAAKIEEYIDLVPPERLPKRHLPAPTVKPDSVVTISLSRSGCFGTCPAYRVEVSTGGISFEGRMYVVASGQHRDAVDAVAVRMLAKEFIASDFYSMDPEYQASVTDCPTYSLAIAVDGRSRVVTDYMGSWVGMPAVISELEDRVDEFANTKRWIEGEDGLVDLLKAERFSFKTFEAQAMLKEASSRGMTNTVSGLLEAGVPLKPIAAPKQKENYLAVSFDHVGWLNAASAHPEILQVLMDADASKNDQGDMDLALLNAARSGKLDAVRALIDYGADPNADFRKSIVTESSGGMTLEGQGAGSVLIEAARSGNPEVVREILRYHPDIEARGREGETALFAAGEYRDSDVDGARVDCIRLLVHAGANVNARDSNGNTPLHGIFLTDVEEELLKLGADVNARNKDGETPIFTNVDNDAISLYIAHGADLSIRDNKGRTVFEAAAEHGPLREEALRKAIEQSRQK
jgi:ankyrin repeat protein